MKKITDYLEQVGLPDVEAKIYVGLLETGPTTIKELADHLKKNRTTLYGPVEGLIDKGLIIETRFGARKQLVAESPDRIKLLLDERITDAQSLQVKLPDILQTIRAAYDTKNEEKDTEIKYYKGRNGIRAIYADVLKSSELRSYVNISQIFEKFPENPQLFPESVEKNNLRMWEIIEDSPRSREYVKTINPLNYKYKFLPHEWNINAFDYMIFDGHIAIVSGDKELNGLLVQNFNIYENARVLFDMMWNLLKHPD